MTSGLFWRNVIQIIDFAHHLAIKTPRQSFIADEALERRHCAYKQFNTQLVPDDCQFQIVFTGNLPHTLWMCNEYLIHHQSEWSAYFEHVDQSLLNTYIFGVRF